MKEVFARVGDWTNSPHKGRGYFRNLIRSQITDFSLDLRLSWEGGEVRLVASC